jgi:hypothetical protein
VNSGIEQGLGENLCRQHIASGSRDCQTEIPCGRSPPAKGEEFLILKMIPFHVWPWERVELVNDKCYDGKNLFM